MLKIDITKLKKIGITLARVGVILTTIFTIITLPIIFDLWAKQITKYTIIKDNSAWISSLITYIGAIASFGMIIITWITLKTSKRQNDAILRQNNDQLNELKKQWEQEQRPNIIFYTQYIGYGSYFLIMKNVGKSIANNIIFSIDETFLDCITDSTTKDYLNKIGKEPIQLFPQQYKKFIFAQDGVSAKKSKHRSETIETFNNMKLNDCHITGTYNNHYIIDQIISLNDYKSAPIETILADIAGDIKQISNAIYKEKEQPVRQK